MKPKFTTGPWFYDIGNNQVEASADRTPICDLCNETDLAHEPKVPVDYLNNGYLIAASPDLYRLLSYCFEELELRGLTYEMNKEILDTLKKARGEK